MSAWFGVTPNRTSAESGSPANAVNVVAVTIACHSATRAGFASPDAGPGSASSTPACFGVRIARESFSDFNRAISASIATVARFVNAARRTTRSSPRLASIRSASARR